MDIRDGWPTTAMRDAPEAQGYEEALSYVYNEDKRILLEEPSVFLSSKAEPGAIPLVALLLTGYVGPATKSTTGKL